MTFPSLFDRTREFELFDDFVHAHDWWLAVNDGASGTNTLNDAHGGTYSIVTAAADNDYHYLASDSELVKFQDDKEVHFICRFKYVEANTDDANLVIGLTDDVSAGAIQDNGAGPPASYDGALFFVVDGGTALQFETSNAGTQRTNTSLLTLVSGQWYVVGFSFHFGDGTTGTIRPWVYDETAGILHNTDGKSSDGWAHPITLSGLAEMHAIVGVKAGGVNAETLTLDYVGIKATR